MGCGCRETAPVAARVPSGEHRVFTCPLDGADITVTVRGTVTPRNLTLVQQYLSFVYEVLTPAPPAPEGEP